MDAIAALNLPPSHWVDVAGGPVHYREWDGPAVGPTFVLVHGLGGSHLNWAPVAPGLARWGRVVALDLAGFGLTPLGGRRADVGSNWRLLDGFLSTLGLGPVVLVGNSMGGQITLIQAAHHPRSTRGLILVDAAFPRARSARAQPPPWIAALFTLYGSQRVGGWFVDNRARRLGAEGLVRETLRVCTADPSSLDPTLVEALVEATRRRLEHDYSSAAFLSAARSIFRAQAFPARYRELVRSITAPALVTHGALDRLVPVGGAREAAQAHANWKLVVFPDLGHIPQMEAPDRWLDAVRDWIEEPGVGGGGESEDRERAG